MTRLVFSPIMLFVIGAFDALAAVAGWHAPEITPDAVLVCGILMMMTALLVADRRGRWA
jgi:hypothetical protein